MESKAIPQKRDETETAQILAKIAGRVRDDSKNKGELTSAALLAVEPARLQSCLAEMAKSETFKDIKSIATATGDAYLYSDSSISRKDAENLAFAEEVRSQIVSKVREDSGKLIKLTAVTSLGALIPGAETDKIDVHLSAILKDERYQDVKLITNSKKTRYLYSENAITQTYAEILARAGANDPVATIAETVRDESRIYPRPTKVDLFTVEIFNINPDRLGEYIAELVKNPEYGDIKQLKASTGATYLYSTLYIKSEDWVKYMVEWEEVGRHQNP